MSTAKHLLVLMGLISISLVYPTDLRAEKASLKEDYQLQFCMKYEMAQDTVDEETIFEEMEAIPLEPKVYLT